MAPPRVFRIENLVLVGGTSKSELLKVRVRVPFWTLVQKYAVRLLIFLVFVFVFVIFVI